MSHLVIYGAYGYTGDLIARAAASAGLDAHLAGRDPGRLRALAEEIRLPHTAVDLDDAAGLDRLLSEAKVVIHCAGPFARTYPAMTAACLRTGTHYLDINGDVAVFEGCAALGPKAEQAKILLMSGAGFDVVPTDCLAASLKARLPGATHLDLAFSPAKASMSRGTATTVVENLHRGSLVRENGLLQRIAMGSRTRRIDFGRGPKLCVAIPWGDVATAYHTTRIPNIAVYLPVPWAMQVALVLSSPFSRLMATGPIQRALKRRVNAAPAGPTAEERAQSRTRLWGEVRDDAGNTAGARFETPDGYTLTAAAALLIAQKVLQGDAPVGFQTPASAYGPDLVLELQGVTRTDL